MRRLTSWMLACFALAQGSVPARGATTAPAPLTASVAQVAQAPIMASPAQAAQLDYPDLTDVIPASELVVVGSGSSKEFQYTHLTLNDGSGPLVIQPVYNPASGNYQGIQYIYSYAGGGWVLQQQIRISGAFIFHAAHGHFHYPLVSYGLYAVAGDGGIGPPVAVSTKIGFCIADSYLYDPAAPHADAPLSQGTCSNPENLRVINVGAVDEYDKTDPGQSIPIPNLPNGTYWFRAIVDPEDFLFESNENNNETDVKLTITGNTVQVLQTITPVLPPPPSIALVSPLDGAHVTGTVALTASTAVTTGVLFLLDGLPLGGIVTANPYTLPWNSASVPDGNHWLSAQTTDANGRTGTSAIASVAVSNSSVQDTVPPTVHVVDPESGATVYATVAISATAADNSSVISLQFYVDGLAQGTPLFAPPYVALWNSSGVSNGLHTISASAIDAAGLVGYSAPITFRVDNSRPPDLIGQDATASADGIGLMQTPAFSTTTPNDLVVAFVAYDGPSQPIQTATVSGAGLAWQLLKRSSAQLGTSEIWAARASGLLTNVTVTSQPGTDNYQGSLNVIAFTNAQGTGVVGQASAPSGAPDVYLPGVAAGSWVFAVGNDWDGAITRTPVSGQVLVDQRIDTPSGDTFWLQSTVTPSAASTLVDIHDDAPINDRWNYAAVEIVATRSASSVAVPPVAARPSKLELRVITNPTHGMLRLSARGPRDGARDLWLLDIGGRRVADLKRGIRLVNGGGSVSWDLDHAPGRISPGVYFVVLVAEGGAIEATAPVVILN